MSNEIFEQIQNEVRELNNEILKICEIDEEVNQLYKGVQVFYSPVIELADVMFIGINPGQGFTTHEGNDQKVNKIEPPVINDYYDESGKYSLARIWI